MFTDTLTLNANAFTGASAAVDHSLIEVVGGTSLRSAPALALTTPQVLDIKHQALKRGRFPYTRSTIGLTRSNVPATGVDPSLGTLSHSVRLVIDRPDDGVAVTPAMITKLWGELLSVFGVSLASGGVPTAAVLKFLNKEP